MKFQFLDEEDARSLRHPEHAPHGVECVAKFRRPAAGDCYISYDFEGCVQGRSRLHYVYSRRHTPQAFARSVVEGRRLAVAVVGNEVPGVQGGYLVVLQGRHGAFICSRRGTSNGR